MTTIVIMGAPYFFQMKDLNTRANLCKNKCLPVTIKNDIWTPQKRQMSCEGDGMIEKGMYLLIFYCFFKGDIIKYGREKCDGKDRPRPIGGEGFQGLWLYRAALEGTRSG